MFMKILRCILVAGLLFPNGVMVYAADQPAAQVKPMVGKLSNVAGSVEVMKFGTSTWVEAKNGMEVGSGDQVAAGIDGKASIEFANSKTEVSPLAQFSVGRNFQTNDQYYTEMFLQVGKVVSHVEKNSGKKNHFTVTTPSSVAGIRGTTLECAYTPGVGAVNQISEGAGFVAPVQADKLPPAIQQILNIQPPPEVREAAAKAAEKAGASSAVVAQIAAGLPPSTEARAVMAQIAVAGGASPAAAAAIQQGFASFTSMASSLNIQGPITGLGGGMASPMGMVAGGAPVGVPGAVPPAGMAPGVPGVPVAPGVPGGPAMPGGPAGGPATPGGPVGGPAMPGGPVGGPATPGGPAGGPAMPGMAPGAPMMPGGPMGGPAMPAMAPVPAMTGMEAFVSMGSMGPGAMGGPAGGMTPDAAMAMMGAMPGMGMGAPMMGGPATPGMGAPMGGPMGGMSALLSSVPGLMQGMGMGAPMMPGMPGGPQGPQGPMGGGPAGMPGGPAGGPGPGSATQIQQDLSQMGLTVSPEQAQALAQMGEPKTALELQQALSKVGLAASAEQIGNMMSMMAEGPGMGPGMEGPGMMGGPGMGPGMEGMGMMPGMMGGPSMGPGMEGMGMMPGMMGGPGMGPGMMGGAYGPVMELGMGAGAFIGSPMGGPGGDYGGGGMMGFGPMTGPGMMGPMMGPMTGPMMGPMDPMMGMMGPMMGMGMMGPMDPMMMTGMNVLMSGAIGFDNLGGIILNVDPNTLPPEMTRDDDGDMIPNGWELLYGMNPNSASDGTQDWDGDGFTNRQEFEFNTNPTNSASIPTGISSGGNGDYDNDGMSDYWEYQNGLDPANAADKTADADGDGYDNMIEFARNTNPKSPTSFPGGPGISTTDYDGDGLPNSWEDAHNYNRYYAADGYRDDDNDGWLNAQEYRKGTDPKNRAPASDFSATPNADDDADGLPNWFEEAATGGNKTTLVSSGNNDGDDWTNFEEFLAGTDPATATSQPINDMGTTMMVGNRNFNGTTYAYSRDNMNGAKFVEYGAGTRIYYNPDRADPTHYTNPSDNTDAWMQNSSMTHPRYGYGYVNVGGTNSGADNATYATIIDADGDGHTPLSAFASTVFYDVDDNMFTNPAKQSPGALPTSEDPNHISWGGNPNPFHH